VPLKLSAIGDEVLATAIGLAEERGSAVRVFHGIKVPMDLPLDAHLPEAAEYAFASLGDARELAQEHGVEIETVSVRTRALGEAIVDQARYWNADLIVLGSAPRWRRQSRFFSPTVDYVLRKAPCEVMVIAYPQGLLEDESEPRSQLRSQHEAVVIGCGRVGSLVGRGPRPATGGTCVASMRRRRAVGPRRGLAREASSSATHDVELLRERASKARTLVGRRDERRQHEHRRRPGAREALRRRCVVVRILDPARAELYSTLGLRIVCPTSSAFSVLIDAARSVRVRPERAAAS
jgi:nucleotide-binding universal stress UspA family protein